MIKEIIGIGVLLIIAIIAIKIVISFDINKWLDQRNERKKEKVRHLCPHATIDVLCKNNARIRSLMTSPPGTFMWVCSRCGAQTHDGGLAQRIVSHYSENPKMLLDDEDKFLKYVKKEFDI